MVPYLLCHHELTYHYDQYVTITNMSDFGHMMAARHLCPTLIAWPLASAVIKCTFFVDMFGILFWPATSNRRVLSLSMVRSKHACE